MPLDPQLVSHLFFTKKISYGEAQSNLMLELSGRSLNTPVTTYSSLLSTLIVLPGILLSSPKNFFAIFSEITTECNCAKAFAALPWTKGTVNILNRLESA